METRDSRREEQGDRPGPVRTVCDGARQLLLQRTPTEGSYQQSLFEEFFFIYNVCLSVRQGRAARQKDLEILGYGFQDMVFRTWDLNSPHPPQKEKKLDLLGACTSAHLVGQNFYSQLFVFIVYFCLA